MCSVDLCAFQCGCSSLLKWERFQQNAVWRRQVPRSSWAPRCSRAVDGCRIGGRDRSKARFANSNYLDHQVRADNAPASEVSDWKPGLSSRNTVFLTESDWIEPNCSSSSAWKWVFFANNLLMNAPKAYTYREIMVRTYSQYALVLQCPQFGRAVTNIYLTSVFRRLKPLVLAVVLSYKDVENPPPPNKHKHTHIHTRTHLFTPLLPRKGTKA